MVWWLARREITRFRAVTVYTFFVNAYEQSITFVRPIFTVIPFGVGFAAYTWLSVASFFPTNPTSGVQSVNGVRVQTNREPGRTGSMSLSHVVLSVFGLLSWAVLFTPVTPPEADDQQIAATPTA